MKTVLFISMVVVTLMVSSTRADSIPGLFNTGAGSGNTRLPSGVLEQHYILTGMSSPAYVSTGIPGIWAEPATDAMWIAPTNGNIDVPQGGYVYTLIFDLTGLDLATATISGKWASDNGSTIYLNGIGTQFNIGAGSYSFLTDFTIAGGFLPNTNTLEFHVTNSLYYDPSYHGSGNPSGLLVQNLLGSAQPVPEPTTLALLGLGALVLRRRKK